MKILEDLIQEIKKVQCEKYGFISIDRQTSTMKLILDKYSDRFTIEELAYISKGECVNEEINRLFENTCEYLDIPRYLLRDYEKTFREKHTHLYWNYSHFGRHHEVCDLDDIIDDELIKSVVHSIGKIKNYSLYEKNLFDKFLEKFDKVI